MEKPLRDSSFNSLGEAIEGTAAPEDIRRMLELIDVEYLSFDDRLHIGQLVVHQAIAQKTLALFRGLYALGFPVAKAVPIRAYGWDDDASMEDNNTSCFNYRPILGTERLSNHSYGIALDVNPKQNPYFPKQGGVYPKGAVHDRAERGTLYHGSEEVKLIKKLGGEWGGDWTSLKDYQHVEFPLGKD